MSILKRLKAFYMLQRMKEVKVKDTTTFSDVIMHKADDGYEYPYLFINRNDIIELHGCMSSLKLNSKDEAEFLRLVSQCNLFEKLKKYCKETMGYKYDIY